MATVRHTGGAAAIKQLDTLTVGGTVEIGDLFTVTIGQKTLSVAATTTSTATTAAEIAAAWVALDKSLYPEFGEMEPQANGSDITVLANTAGIPFTLTVATTEAGGGAADLQTFVKVATTAATGPNFWNDAKNWDGSAVPVNADDVTIDSGVDILHGLAQSAVTLTSLTIKGGSKIGLAERNAGGYPEYRAKELNIKSTTVTIDCESERIKVNFDISATTVHVRATGQGGADEAGVKAVVVRGTNAANVLNVSKGSVDSALFAGHTATWATVRISYVDNPDSDAVVSFGSGCTLTTLTQSGGVVETNSAITTLNQSGGSHVHFTGTITTHNFDAGTFLKRGLFTVTTGDVGSKAVLDCRKSALVQTVTNVLNLYAGAKVLDPLGTLTLSAGFKCVGCGIEEVEVQFGADRTFTVV